MSNKITQKITTNLWFAMNAAEAVDFYLGIFKDSGKGRSTYYTKDGYEFHQIPEGTLMTQEFTLEGIKFVALNGGPIFKFTEAISFIINVETQEELDHYWDKLTAGGDPASQVCGWLKDKFGVSWQVVPTVLTELLESSDEAKVSRVVQAMFKMKKLDIQQLKDAANA